MIEVTKHSNLDDLESRIKFLISLLEKCRNQLEYEAVNGPNSTEGRNLLRDFDQSSSEMDSLMLDIREKLKDKYNSLSKQEIYEPLL